VQPGEEGAPGVSASSWEISLAGGSLIGEEDFGLDPDGEGDALGRQQAPYSLVAHLFGGALKERLGGHLYSKIMNTSKVRCESLQEPVDVRAAMRQEVLGSPERLSCGHFATSRRKTSSPVRGAGDVIRSSVGEWKN
jgi:hypothetical protein